MGVLTLLSRNHVPQDCQFPDLAAALPDSLAWGSIVPSMAEWPAWASTVGPGRGRSGRPCDIHRHYSGRAVWGQDGDHVGSGYLHNGFAAKLVPRTVVEGIEAGHLEFVLPGKTLRSPFALVHMRGQARDKASLALHNTAGGLCPSRVSQGRQRMGTSEPPFQPISLPPPAGPPACA
jgi:hypothetical protein